MGGEVFVVVNQFGHDAGRGDEFGLVEPLIELSLQGGEQDRAGLRVELGVEPVHPCDAVDTAP